MSARKHTLAVGKNAIRIMIVDDHPLIRDALTALIEGENDLCVCGQAEDRQPALDMIAATHPQLVLVDLILKSSHGLELIKDIHVRYPQIYSLVLSIHLECLYAQRALQAGASGFVGKQSSSETILQAIRQVLRGEIYLSESVTRDIVSKVAGRATAAAGMPIQCLADRELQVFELLGKGHTTHKIADELHLDISTVETYRSRIKDKLKLKDAGELLECAIQWALNQRL
jgi:DNA-binding NarL/FixJ family response regulator